MIPFLASVALLILGYFVYGKIIEKIFGIQPERATPAQTRADGVDFVQLPTWKVFMIQLLDIAGIGPIFGPIMGALWGPQALLWIVVGSIFAGGVHDYFAGMLSIRFGGENLPTIVGRTMGRVFRHIMLVFSLLLLIFVGVVFVLSPANMLNQLSSISTSIWIAAIFGYYFIATILPIDKIIGRFYPFLGILLLFMTFGIFFGLVLGPNPILPDLNFSAEHPKELPLWPLLFITLSCGAISGFHSTQSPLMSRCLNNERNGRRVFYGAMIAEGIIALIWCTVGLSLYEPAALQAMVDEGTAALVVNDTSRQLLGVVGGFLAILGVIVLPITSGDTAFRSARLIASEALHLEQKTSYKRLYLAIPLFAVGFVLSQLEFGVVWRYFGWSNQTLAMLVLWSSAVWLALHHKVHWIASLPATVLTAVSVTFICYNEIGFSINYQRSVVIGIIAAIGLLITFVVWNHQKRRHDGTANS